MAQPLPESLGALLRRDVLIGLVGALLVLGVTNVVVSLSATRETYKACSRDESICVIRQESFHIPGVRRIDEVWIGDGGGTCGVNYSTPFEIDGRPTFREQSVELRGFEGERITYDTSGDC